LQVADNVFKEHIARRPIAWDPALDPLHLKC